jgi:hypothetical protein
MSQFSRVCEGAKQGTFQTDFAIQRCWNFEWQIHQHGYVTYLYFLFLFVLGSGIINLKVTDIVSFV